MTTDGRRHLNIEDYGIYIGNPGGNLECDLKILKVEYLSNHSSDPPQILKVEYLSDHLSDPPQILNLSQ